MVMVKMVKIENRQCQNRHYNINILFIYSEQNNHIRNRFWPKWPWPLWPAKVTTIKFFLWKCVKCNAMLHITKFFCISYTPCTICYVPGCVFAMPGSTVTQQAPAAAPLQNDEQPDVQTLVACVALAKLIIRLCSWARMWLRRWATATPAMP